MISEYWEIVAIPIQQNKLRRVIRSKQGDLMVTIILKSEDASPEELNLLLGVALRLMGTQFIQPNTQEPPIE